MSSLVPGTSGQFLQTQGTGANPVWTSSTDITGPTLIVAASDSNDTARADYQCSGTNDDATIESAIAALPAVGGTVLLLEGTYAIDSNGVDIAKSNVSLIGSGRSTILERNWTATMFTGGAGVVTVGDYGTTQVSGVVVANLAVDGNKTSHTGEYNIGILFLYDVSSSKVENNWVYNCDGYGIRARGNSGGNENYYNSFIGNDVRNNDYAGVYIDYGHYSVIADNVVKSNAINGITLDNSDYCTVTNNIFEANARRGFYLYYSDYATVSGNVASHTTASNGYGICAYESYYNTINGNTCYQNAEYGIFLENSSYSNVIGNKLHDNGGVSDASSLRFGGTSTGNLLAYNDITDTAGSGVYAIVLASSGHYLIGNRYSGTGADQMIDYGTNTVQHWNELEIDGTFQAYELLTEAQNSGVTLTSSDFGKTITVDNASTQTVTLPSVSSSDIGAWFRVVKLGSGQVTVDAADSDTIADSTAGGTIYNSQSGQDYATITIQLANSTEWVITKAQGTWTTN